MSRRTPQPSFTAILSGGHTHSPVSTNPVRECNTIRNRWFGERLLDFLAERRCADVFNIKFPLPTGPALVFTVSGHGVPVALIASMVKLAATSQFANATDPAKLLSGMNAVLCGNTQDQFVTAAYVYLDASSRTLKYSAAAAHAVVTRRKSSRDSGERSHARCFFFCDLLNCRSPAGTW